MQLTRTVHAALRRQAIWKGTTQVGCANTNTCSGGIMYSCRYFPAGAAPAALSLGLLSSHLTTQWRKPI